MNCFSEISKFRVHVVFLCPACDISAQSFITSMVVEKVCPSNAKHGLSNIFIFVLIHVGLFSLQKEVVFLNQTKVKEK